MKTKIALAILLSVIWICDVVAIDATEAELSAGDLAAFTNVRHKTFTIENDGKLNEISYRIDIYKNGKVVKSGGIHSDKTSSAKIPKQRISILYRHEGSIVRVAVKSDGFTDIYDIDMPDGVDGFPKVTDGVRFDKEGRLVLGFDVEKDDKGVKSVTNRNSTPEGAKAALVFQIEIK